jgi:hypothetical protein
MITTEKSALISHGRSAHVVRYEMTRGLIFSIRAERSDSAVASSFVACFAVLSFEPHATMPPSNNETAAAMLTPGCGPLIFHRYAQTIF